MTEFCCFRVGEWAFIFLNECPMTVICYRIAPSHIDHLLRLSDIPSSQLSAMEKSNISSTSTGEKTGTKSTYHV